MESIWKEGQHIPEPKSGMVAMAYITETKHWPCLKLAALLFIGTALAFTSIETFASSAVALLSALKGVTLGAVWIILGLAHLVTEAVLHS